MPSLCKKRHGNLLGAANVESDASWTAAMATGSTAGAAGAILELTLSDAATPASCKVSYTAPSASGTSASVAVTTSGC